MASSILRGMASSILRGMVSSILRGMASSNMDSSHAVSLRTWEERGPAFALAQPGALPWPRSSGGQGSGGQGSGGRGIASAVHLPRFDLAPFDVAGSMAPAPRCRPLGRCCMTFL